MPHPARRARIRCDLLLRPRPFRPQKCRPELNSHQARRPLSARPAGQSAVPILPRPLNVPRSRRFPVRHLPPPDLLRGRRDRRDRLASLPGDWERHRSCRQPEWVPTRPVVLFLRRASRSLRLPVVLFLRRESRSLRLPEPAGRGLRHGQVARRGHRAPIGRELPGVSSLPDSSPVRVDRRAPRRGLRAYEPVRGRLEEVLAEVPVGARAAGADPRRGAGHLPDRVHVAAGATWRS